MIETRTTKYIRTFNDPALSAVCLPVQPDDDLSFIADMRAVLRAHDDGVGLAAPQIGVLKRACVIWAQRKGGECVVMLNPSIMRHGPKMVTASEGCLSYPGFFTPVERHASVHVRWTDPRGKNEREQWFVGFSARVVQHELDHLDGVCLVGDAWRSSPS